MRLYSDAEHPGWPTLGGSTGYGHKVAVDEAYHEAASAASEEHHGVTPRDLVGPYQAHGPRSLNIRTLVSALGVQVVTLSIAHPYRWIWMSRQAGVIWLSISNYTISCTFSRNSTCARTPVLNRPLPAQADLGSAERHELQMLVTRVPVESWVRVYARRRSRIKSRLSQ